MKKQNFFEIRNEINENLENAMANFDDSEVFLQFKYGFSIDISEITIRVAKDISKQLDVKVPKDIFEVADPNIPFTLDSVMYFRTRLELTKNANISNKNILSKFKLFSKTVSEKLYNGDFDDIIGFPYDITSTESGKTYPVLAVSGLFVNNTYLFIDWYVIENESGIGDFEFAINNK